MNKELIITIDLEKLTQDVLEKETYADGNSGYAVVSNRVKEEIKNSIVSSAVREIRDNLELEKLKETRYSGEYLKEEAKKLLSEDLETLVKKYTEDWIKANMRFIVEKQAENSIEEFLVPRLQKMINNLLVVNTESVDQEMQALKDDYEYQLKSLE